MVVFMMCLCLVVQAQTTVQSQSDLGIFRFPLFERAVRCIKFYEGWHDIKRNYPYIGWGHCVQPHENFKKNLTLEQADSLLRSDLRTFCVMFRKYGKDSLLLAVLAYNVGPYKVLGDRRKFRKSRLLQKIERGERDIEREYLDFCRWKGKVIFQKLNILDAVMFDVRRLPIMEKDGEWCLTNGGSSDCFHMIKHSQ